MKIDASHKLVKLILVYSPGAGTDTKLIYGVVTIFNELEQVCKGVLSRVFIPGYPGYKPRWLGHIAMS